MIDTERPRLRRFRERLAELIPCDPEDVRVDLRKMQARELLKHYLNWADRYVAPRPRVVTWDGFLRHGSSQPHLEALRDLAKKIEAGDDLTPLLSKRINRFGYVRPKAHKKNKPPGIEWEDKDYALNAFETHHLHLTSKGTKELLYVIFSRDAAFLVMVGDHKSFDDNTLAQAIAEARVGTRHEIKSVLGPGSRRTMREQNELQRRGLSTVFQVGEQTVMGALLTIAGTSPLLNMHAARVIKCMITLDPQLDDPGFGREWFERNGRDYPARALSIGKCITVTCASSKPRLKLDLSGYHGDDSGLSEPLSRVRYRLADVPVVPDHRASQIAVQRLFRPCPYRVPPTRRAARGHGAPRR
jgi:hypothetical protein